MGIETALLIGTAVASVASGASAMVGAKQQADASTEQAEAQARAQAKETLDFEKQQKLNFLKSGVSLEGSPLLIMAETRDQGVSNIQNIQDQGATAASNAIAGGRSALIGSVASAAKTGLSALDTSPDPITKQDRRLARK